MVPDFTINLTRIGLFQNGFIQWTQVLWAEFCAPKIHMLKS